MGCQNEILKRIREKCGLALDKSVDFEILAQAICDETEEHLGSNTLKRMFGYKIAKVAPRRSTMDIIARYLGFSDYEALILELGDDADISAFSAIDNVDFSMLNHGDLIKITYEPNRTLLLKYHGDIRFKLLRVEGTKNLQVNDELLITQLVAGHRLVATHVFRDGRDLGAYEAAKSKGVQGVEIIN